MMAEFEKRKENIKEVVVKETATKIPVVKKILKKIEKIQNIKFIIPKDAEYSTIIGAVRKFIKQ